MASHGNRLADGLGFSSRIPSNIGRRVVEHVLRREPHLVRSHIMGAKHWGTKPYVEARHEIMWKLRTLGYSANGIGRFLGVDQSTVVHHLNKPFCMIAGSAGRARRVIWKPRKLRQVGQEELDRLRQERETKPNIKGKWTYVANPEVADRYMSRAAIERQVDDEHAFATRPTQGHKTLTAVAFGDPLPGRSALDRRSMAQPKQHGAKAGSWLSDRYRKDGRRLAAE